METRQERDSMGPMVVPAAAYYGAQTRRASLNFAISPLRFPRSFLRALGLIKASAAKVNTDLGLLGPALPREFATSGPAAILQAAEEVIAGRLDDQFVVDVFQTGSGTSTNMNANEVIAGRANEILTGRRGGKAPVHPNDHVNLGQSSNDVIPTAIHVAALEALTAKLLPELDALAEALAAKAAEFDGVVKLGRTHLQDAVPIRLGQEFGGFAAQVRKGSERVRAVTGSLAELAIGGTAVGTGINTHEDFPRRMAEELARVTGLPFRPASNPFEAMAAKDAAVEASSALRTVAISLSIIANNLRWLASGPRGAIGEITIPELQPGSSIMPGKVNPVIAEAVMMAAAQVVGNDATIAWANGLGSNFQLNVMMPVIAYNLLQSIDLLTEAARHLRDRCLDARDFFEEQQVRPPGVEQVRAEAGRCSALVEKSLAMCTALAPRIGYDAAAAVAKAAYRDDRLVRAVALELPGKTAEEAAASLGLVGPPEVLADRGVPTAAEIDRLLDPFAQTIRGSGVGGPAGG